MSALAPAHGLADEHAVLQQELERRGQLLLQVLDAGEWPAEEIQRLLDYLRYEVLDQAVHEERLLYPLTEEGLTGPRIHQLVDDHARLRELANRLAAASACDEKDTERLRATVRELCERLDRHVRREQGVLSDTGIESVRQPFHSHEWFVLTEGSTLDMDRLPDDWRQSAVLDRLSRMRSGESLELISGRPLQPVHALLVRRGMSAGYGWVYVEEGPRRWRAEVTRRTIG